MGLFDKFKDIRKNRDDRKIAAALAKIKNAKAIREDRAAAIEYFNQHDDPHVAVPALLQRFEYSLEHGINDTREKESSMQGIVNFGADALPHVREHLQVSTRIAWPIKILKKLADEPQVIDVLKSALDFGEVSFDQAKVDKNYDILCYLVEYKLPNFADELAHFLGAMDERVRFAAAEALIEQEDPRVAGHLEKFLSDESPDNTRVRKSVIEAFLKHGWTVTDTAVFPNGQVVGPLFVGQNNRLELRQ